MATAKQTPQTMQIYDSFRSVPKEAQKTITGGRLNGFTDINPMWRIKMLTERFGPCGVGWYTGDIKTWKEDGNGETSVYVSLNLYYRVGEEWSAPVFGIGGSKVLARERGGVYHDDESYKKAYTDALSIACKGLGMAADIYFKADIKTRDNVTKYDQIPQESYIPEQAAPAPEAPAFQPMSNDNFFKCVMTYASGYEPTGVGNIREYYIQKTHAGAKEIADFDAAVQNYKIANNL